jgi:hypothetical protein
LLEEQVDVEYVSVLGQLVAFDTANIYRIEGVRPACCGNAEPISVMGS